MGGTDEASVAATMCELCGTMLRVSAASSAAAQAGLAEAWEITCSRATAPSWRRSTAPSVEPGT